MLRAAANQKPPKQSKQQQKPNSDSSPVESDFRPHPEVYAARTSACANTRLAFKMRKLTPEQAKIDQHIADAKIALEFMQRMNALPEAIRVKFYRKGVEAQFLKQQQQLQQQQESSNGSVDASSSGDAATDQLGQAKQ